jgi:hypothetical protein
MGLKHKVSISVGRRENGVMTIYQPRRENVSTFTILKESLYRWAEEILKPTAEFATGVSVCQVHRRITAFRGLEFWEGCGRMEDMIE